MTTITSVGRSLTCPNCLRAIGFIFNDCLEVVHKHLSFQVTGNARIRLTCPHPDCGRVSYHILTNHEDGYKIE